MSTRYAFFYQASGEIFQTLTLTADADPERVAGMLEDGQSALEIPEDGQSVSWLTHRVINEELVKLDEPRTIKPGQSFDLVTGVWGTDPQGLANQAKAAIEQEEAVSLRALREAVLELAKNKPDFNHPSIAKLITSDAKIGKLRKVIAKAGK